MYLIAKFQFLARAITQVAEIKSFLWNFVRNIYVIDYIYILDIMYYILFIFDNVYICICVCVCVCVYCIFYTLYILG